MTESKQHPPLINELQLALSPLLWRAFAASSLVSLLVLAPVLYMFEVYGRVLDSQSLATLFWLFVALRWLLLLMPVAGGGC
jgi:ATP-binding cassette, subfamily C, bacterial exporter for protease/lipase